MDTTTLENNNDESSSPPPALPSASSSSFFSMNELFKLPEGSEKTVSGWVGAIRDIGRVVFVVLRDASGSVQTVASNKFCTPELIELARGLHQEDLLSITGIITKNPQVAGGAELRIKNINVIARAKNPLPLDPSGKVDANFDTRLDNRVLDLRNHRVSDVFILKSRLLFECHEHFMKHGFIQVNTPKIVATGAEGGSTLFPINYYNREAYLTQSPQLYKQMLMASGLRRVYEIAPAWRAEKSHTTRHVSEFVSVDAEMAFIENEEDVMRVIEGLVKHLVSSTPADIVERFGQAMPKLEFPRITYEKACSMLGIPFGADLSSEAERELGTLMKKEQDADFYFITGYPSEVKPFYVMVEKDNPQICKAFDLEFRGLEILSGAQREHRPELLRERMKELGIEPLGFESYIAAFEHGMPPHGGFGLGIERFIEELLGLGNVREAVLFPRDCERLAP